MTRPTSAPCRHLSAAGFTLVELLVVIGIIILLVGLLSPMVSRAYRSAERTRVVSDLNSIAAALEAYKQDQGAYPDPGPNSASTPGNNRRGANALCRALIAPGPATLDGADGPGFRVRPGGKVWPAYLPAEQFRVGDVNGVTPTDFTTMTLSTYQQLYILDRFKKPILYYRANANADIRTSNGFANNTGRPLYDYSQNSGAWDSASALPGFRAMLGDIGNGTPSPTLQGNGQIDKNETPAHTGPYLLWSPGPDEIYGPVAGDGGNSSALDQPDLTVCDDITNFRS